MTQDNTREALSELAENLRQQAREQFPGDPLELWVDRADLLLILAALSPQPPAPIPVVLNREEVYATMERIDPNWNALGTTRGRAVDLAIRVAQQLLARASAPTKAEGASK